MHVTHGRRIALAPHSERSFQDFGRAMMHVNLRPLPRSSRARGEGTSVERSSLVKVSRRFWFLLHIHSYFIIS